jgi:putative ABC transport system permease protein
VTLLLRRTARAQWAPLLTLGLLVLLTAFLADAGPRTLVAGYDRAARETVAGAPFGSTDLVVTSPIPPVAPEDEHRRAKQLAASAPGLARLDAHLRGLFPPALRKTVVTADHFAATPFMALDKGPGLQLSLGYSATAYAHLRYVAGHAPGEPERAGEGTRFEAALPVRAAQRLGVRAGDVLTTAGEPPIAVRVTGLFTPADPASGYWPAHAYYRDAELKKTPSGQVIVLATALVNPDGYQALTARTPFRIDLSWVYTPGAGRVTAATAPELSREVGQASESIATFPDIVTPELNTRFDDILDGYVRRLRAAQTLLSLSLSGLFAAALGVLALVVRLMLARMGTGLATQTARGASRTQLAVLAATLAALAALPAAAVGLALSAFLVPGPAQTISLVAVALLVVTTVALPAAVAARERRTPRGGRRVLSRRTVAEATVVLLAVAGTYMLRRRGLTTGAVSGGVDPFLAAVPALLALATGLVVLRILPYPLRLAGRALARGRSAAPFVGMARASRQGATAVLPLVILLLAVAVIGFGGAVRTSLSRTQRVTTYESVGGDARVDSLAMSAAMADRVRRTPGVRATLPTQIIDGARLLSHDDVVDELRVIGVDLTAYRRLMAGTGATVPTWPRSAPGGPVPALFSASAAGKAHVAGLTLSTDYGRHVPLRDIGSVPRFPSQNDTTDFVLVPADALARATGGGDVGTLSIFVRGDHIDAAALRRAAAQPGVDDAGASTVTTYEETHRTLTQGELGRLVGRGFGVTALLLACYGTLAVLVVLFAGAQARGRTVSYLRTLGLSRRQSQLLAFTEIAPTLTAAAVAGWLLGLALPGLLGPAIDLRPYTGGTPVTHYVPDLPSTVALAGGLLVFAGLAVLIDAATAARRGLGGVLRIGEA